MKSFKNAFNKADEYYTPSCLVELLKEPLEIWRQKFVSKQGREPVIWCPFDTSKSKYVTLLEDWGYTVVATHIDEGFDFFEFEPDLWDIAVSNPPFSKKRDIFERFVFDLKKPFVMLMNMMAINYQEIGNLFQFIGEDIQFLIPDKKVSFDGNTSSFCSGYVCYKFIDRTKFVHLENNNSKQYFKE